jgi:hypothetical protein
VDLCGALKVNVAQMRKCKTVGKLVKGIKFECRERSIPTQLSGVHNEKVCVRQNGPAYREGQKCVDPLNAKCQKGTHCLEVKAEFIAARSLCFN